MSIQLFHIFLWDFFAISRPGASGGVRQSICRHTTSHKRLKPLSESCRQVALVLFSAALLCCAASVTRAQQVSVTIRVIPDPAGRAIIEGNCTPTKVWSFRDNYAGILSLGSRIDGLRLYDANGSDIPNRKLAPGQFESETPASRFRYEVNLAPPIFPADAAKVSWLNTERGLLMLGDLLPAFPRVTSDGTRPADKRASGSRVTLRLSLPAGWAGYSNEKQNAQGELVFADGDRAVIAVGNQIRSSSRTVSGMNLNLVADGQWAFSDSEAFDQAEKVLKAHREVFGSTPSSQATLILFPFPQAVAGDKWSAETRGSSVTLLMGKLPSKVGALAQLSTPLTHEFFHCWVPNGLALDGDYDWFYEGFTIYQAARTAVRLELLTFPEFLNAIARAYDGYAGGADHDRWSLIEASRRRWTGGGSSVYSKSMVIAFLYDLKLRNQSHGKHSLDDVYRKIFRDHSLSDSNSTGAAVAEGSDGNDAATNALAVDSGAQDFVRVFISNPVALNLQEELAPFGLIVERFGLRSRISVNEKLSKQQRDLLRQLGYNDAVRSPRQGKHD
jgi:hypothetical protein